MRHSCSFSGEYYEPEGYREMRKSVGHEMAWRQTDLSYSERSLEAEASCLDEFTYKDPKDDASQRLGWTIHQFCRSPSR